MLLDTLYRIARPILFQLDPERVHDAMLELAPRLSPLLPRPAPSTRHYKVGSLDCVSPVGLAAGLDKNGRGLPLWEKLGFGFAEIGTVLPQPQLGNSRPRIKRLVDRKALANSMGFPSEGQVVVAGHLEKWRGQLGQMKLGINLGKNKRTPLDEAHQDYASVAARLGRYADYLTVNVSSPNTPGLRKLARPEALKRILGAVRHAAPRGTPVWVKLSPDQEADELDATVEAAISEGVEGIVATNTTAMNLGGLSGEPLYPLAQATIFRTLDQCKGRAAVIGCGGIHEATQVAKLLGRGCAGVQLLTALIYEGPGLPRQINEDLRVL